MTDVRARESHGSGHWHADQFGAWGSGTVVEDTVLVFRPMHIDLGTGVYVGHHSILKAYPRGHLVIGDGSWVGEQSYLNSAGGITIGRNVGIGVGARLFTSQHTEQGRDVPILHSRLDYAAIEIGDDSDIGVGAIILPGVRIGRGVQVGAGALVTSNLVDYCVAAGVPARVLRHRPEAS